MRTKSRKIKAIHFKDGIYVAVNHKKKIEYDETIEGADKKVEKAFNLWENKIKKEAKVTFDSVSVQPKLFGGRVIITGDTGKVLFVDGVKIIDLNLDSLDIEYPSSLELNHNIEIEKITSYLNAIETYGVDTFFNNYKTNLNEYKTYLENILSRSQSDTSEEPILEDDFLEILMKTLFFVNAFLFMTNNHLLLSIENEKVNEIYAQVVQMFD